MIKGLKTLALAAFALGVAPVCFAADSKNASGGSDWPHWMGPDNNGISKETIADKWPEGGPKKLWSVKVGAGYGSIAAKDGKVYISALADKKETLYALDAATGKEVWKDVGGNGFPNDDYPGARTTPYLDGDRIYTFDGNAKLVAHDLATGKPVWTVDTLAESGAKPLTWGQGCNPLVLNDRIFVQTGTGGNIALAIEKATGKVAWKSEATGKAGYAHIIAVDVEGKQQLIVFGGDTLWGMDPATGKTLWKQPWKTQYDVNAANPVYDGKGNLFVASAYNTGGGMFQLSASGAKKVWGPTRELQCRFQPPILDGDTLYIVTEEKRGTIKAVAWPTNKVLWDLKEPKVGYGGSILRVGDKLISQSQTGEISLIQATAKEGKLISTFKPYSHAEKIWTMPVVHDGKLYGKSIDELFCFDLK